ncbi:hypothetical protein CGZ75_18350 [Paenibacillus herberti]|uniref:Uncharacterized protein n=1 Tax=Paenibacillus herberti TaxID=1619309 RepID=A0A229NY81_9BACL|nr:hypothetical protein CGZ75_18350 [Paenibacillus herberti]
MWLAAFTPVGRSMIDEVAGIARVGVSSVSKQRRGLSARGRTSYMIRVEKVCFFMVKRKPLSRMPAGNGEGLFAC